MHNNNFVRLRSDLETRLFLLYFASQLSVEYTEHNFEIRATWSELTKGEAARIERSIDNMRRVTTQMKFN